MTQIGLFDSQVTADPVGKPSSDPVTSDRAKREVRAPAAAPRRPTTLKGRSIVRLVEEQKWHHEVETYGNHSAVFVWINVRNDSGSTCKFGQAESLDDAPCKPSVHYDAHLAAAIERLKPAVVERALMEGKI